MSFGCQSGVILASASFRRHSVVILRHSGVILASFCCHSYFSLVSFWHQRGAILRELVVNIGHRFAAPPLGGAALAYMW